MVSVDVQGIRAVQEEFELMPQEVERGLARAVRRTNRLTDTAIRREFRSEVGVDVRGSRIRVRSGMRSAVRGQIWGGGDDVPVDYLRGAVTESKGNDGRPRYYVFGKYIPGAFRGPRGRIRGRGRLRVRQEGSRRSELVKASVYDAIVLAFDVGARTASDVLLGEFEKEVSKIVRQTRV